MKTVYLSLSIGMAILVLLLLPAGCKSLDQSELRSQLMVNLSGGNLELAEHALRQDDFREFEKAEEHFKALIISNGRDEHVTGWLVQLYVAWAEQLRIEVDALEVYLDSLGVEALERTNGNAACIRDLVDQRRRQMVRVLKNAETLGESLMRQRYDDYLCHRVMADYYRVRKQREPMDKELAEVERLRPESNGLKFIRGAALAQFDGDYDSAIIHYYEALAEEPMFVKALYFVGLAYHECGRIYDAKRTMRQVLEKSPGHPGARIYLDPKGYIAGLVAEAGMHSEAAVEGAEGNLIHPCAH